MKKRVLPLNNTEVKRNVLHWQRDAFAKFSHYFGSSDYEQACARELFNQGVVYFYKNFPLENVAEGGINIYQFADFVVAVNVKRKKFTGTFYRDNKDVAWIRDYKEIGEGALHWAVELANHDSTIANALIERREGGDRVASDEATAKGINTMLKRRAEGTQTTAVYDFDIGEYQIVSRNSQVENILDFIQARRECYNMYKEALGIPIDTDKRSQSITDELDAINAQSLNNKEHLERLATLVRKMYLEYKEEQAE